MGPLGQLRPELLTVIRFEADVDESHAAVPTSLHATEREATETTHEVTEVTIPTTGQIDP